MKAVVSELPADSLLRKQPGWLEHEAVVGVTFSLKTYAASLLALFIAFWAALDDPRWAVLTVFVESQPDSGLVVAKSFYRMLGTVAGVLVSICCKIARCRAAKSSKAIPPRGIAKNSSPYWANANTRAILVGYQLAGYTAAIVGLPAALEPSGAYPLIVARFTEISLGIACASAV